MVKVSELRDGQQVFAVFGTNILPMNVMVIRKFPEYTVVDYMTTDGDLHMYAYSSDVTDMFRSHAEAKEYIIIERERVIKDIRKDLDKAMSEINRLINELDDQREKRDKSYRL